MNGLPIAPPKRYFFRMNTANIAGASRDLLAIVEALLEKTNAQTSILYKADEEPDEFRAVAAHAQLRARIPQLGVTIGHEATSILRRTSEPVKTSPVADRRFANLPEVLQYGARHVLVFPLRAADWLLGFLTLARTREEAFGAEEIQQALPFSRLAAAVLERDALQIALKERKLVERAKGLIQQRRGVSEEDAYLLLRNQSRRLRRPMRELAEEIIGAAELRKTA